MVVMLDHVACGQIPTVGVAERVEKPWLSQNRLLKRSAADCRLVDLPMHKTGEQACSQLPACGWLLLLQKTSFRVLSTTTRMRLSWKAYRHHTTNRHAVQQRKLF